MREFSLFRTPPPHPPPLPPSTARTPRAVIGAALPELFAGISTEFYEEFSTDKVVLD